MECAFCNNEMEGSLIKTKEHIIPDGLIKLFPNEDISFIKEKYFKDNNGLTIRDVCNKCNNEILSDLDSYGNRLIANQFMCSFGIANNYNREFPFKFNYHLLARWLIKIAYNYDRSDKSDSKWFKDNIDYILEGDNFRGDFSLFVGLHISMLPVPEEVHGKLSLSIIKNPQLLPLGVTYSVYSRDRNRDNSINSVFVESIYVIRFASAVFLLMLWKDRYDKEKIEFEEKIERLFTFEKLVPEKETYRVRRVSEAFNSMAGYGAISGKQGLEFSERVIRHSINGRNFWDARAESTKTMYSSEFLDEGRRLVEAIQFPRNKEKNIKKKRKRKKK